MKEKLFVLNRDFEESFKDLFQAGKVRIVDSKRGIALKSFFEVQFGKGAKYIKSDKCNFSFPVNTGFDNFRRYFTGRGDRKINTIDMGFLLFYLLTIGKCKKSIVFDDGRYTMDKIDFPIEIINKVLNVFFRLTRQIENDELNKLDKLVQCFSSDSSIGLCELGLNEKQELFITPLVQKSNNENNIKKDGDVDIQGVKEDSEFIEFEPIISKGLNYEEVRFIDDFFDKNKSSLIRFLRRVFVPKRSEKKYYKDYKLNSVFGNDKVISQMMNYYIPARFNVTGDEDDILFHQFNQEKSEELEQVKTSTDISNKNLIQELWEQAIINDNSPNFFFVLAGTGRGKTSLIIKLYLKYLQEEHKLKDLKLVIATKFDSHFDYKIDAIVNKCKKYSQTYTSTKFIILIDALDEDIQINNTKSFKQRLFQISEKLSFFHSVVITSRKQIFTTKHEIEIIKDYMRSSVFYFINPFSNSEVNLYIQNKYGRNEHKKNLANLYVKQYGENFISTQMLLSFMDYLIDNEINHNFQSKEELYHEIIGEWKRREADYARKKFQQPNYADILHNYSIQVAQRFYEEQIFGASKIDLDVIQRDVKKFAIYNRAILHSTTTGYYFFAHKSFLDYFIAAAAVESIDFDDKLTIESPYQGVEGFYYFLGWENILLPIKEHRFSNLTFRYKGDVKEYDIRSLTYQKINDVDYVRYSPSGDISEKEYKNVVRLFKNVSLIDLSNQGLKEIPKLKNALNVTTLKLNNNLGINISNLKLYQNLLNLEITDSDISNIEVLSELKKLERLDLDTNEIIDITPLSKLSKVYFLSLKNNEIEIFSPLTNLHSIETLLIDNNPIKESISILRSCLNLKRLGFSVLNVKEKDIILNHVEDIKRIRTIEISFEVGAFEPTHYISLRKIRNNLKELSFGNVQLRNKYLDLFLREGSLMLFPYSSVSKLSIEEDKKLKEQTVFGDIYFNDFQSIQPVIRLININNTGNIQNVNRLGSKIDDLYYIIFPENEENQTVVDISKEYNYEIKFSSFYIKGVPKNLNGHILKKFNYMEKVMFISLPINFMNQFIVFDEDMFLPAIEKGNLKEFAINGWLHEILNIQHIEVISNIFQIITINNIRCSVQNWHLLLKGWKTIELTLSNILEEIYIGYLYSFRSPLKKIELLNCSVSGLFNLESFHLLEEIILNNVKLSDNYSRGVSKKQKELFRRLIKLHISNIDTGKSFLKTFMNHDLSRLKDLKLQNVKFDKYNFQLRKLEYLHLDNITLNNFSFLPTLKVLIHLTMKNLKLDKAPQMSKNIIKLDLSNNNLTDLKGLEKLKRLTSLTCNENNLKDISQIQNHPNLIELHLSKNEITNISFISNLEKLEVLNISHNSISDLSPLKGLKKLRELHINGNNIENIDVIKELANMNLYLLYVDKNITTTIETRTERELEKISYLKEINVLKDYQEIPFSCEVIPVEEKTE